MQTHWRKSVSREELGSWDLVDSEGNNFERTLTIDKIVVGDKTGIDGTKKKGFMYFKEERKPLILNVVNGTAIAKKYGNFQEKWIGKTITLFVANVKVGTAWMDAIRVKVTSASAEIPALTPDHPHWEAIKTALVSGDRTLEQIKQKFTLTAEDERLVQIPTVNV